jgi:hypothetical protein
MYSSHSNLPKGNVISLKPVLVTRTQNAQSEDQSHKIPVHSFFSNEKLWQSAPQQQLWTYTRNGKLLIEENSETVINVPIVANAYTMTVSCSALIDRIQADLSASSPNLPRLE